MGIHYTYGANKGSKLMEKKAKRERKLAEKRAKKIAKSGFQRETNSENTNDVTKPITLDDITNPNKGKWILV